MVTDHINSSLLRPWVFLAKGIRQPPHNYFSGTSRMKTEECFYDLTITYNIGRWFMLYILFLEF